MSSGSKSHDVARVQSMGAPTPAMRAFDEKFQKEYKYKSDHNGMKGYSAAYVVKAITEKNKKFDSKEFAKALHGAKILVKDYPGAPPEGLPHAAPV